MRLTFRYGSYGRHAAAAITDVTVLCHLSLQRPVMENVVGGR